MQFQNIQLWRQLATISLDPGLHSLHTHRPIKTRINMKVTDIIVIPQIDCGAMEHNANSLFT